jgi:capsular exopolysaccharide synthesis family protein
VEFRDYLAVIKARRGVIVQAALVVLLVAIVMSVVTPRVYEGEARVLIAESDTGAAIFGAVVSEFSSQPERSLQTQVQLVQMRPLLENTIRRLDLKMTPEDLSEQLVVTSVGQTNIIRVVARHSDAGTAAAIANTVAEEFVSWSQEARRESIQAAAAEVETRLEQAKEQILELGRRIRDEGKSDELDAALDIATGSYVTLAEKLEELRINEQLETGSGRVVSPAATPAEPVEPNLLRNILIGIVVGLVFGLSMAFINEYMDDTVKSSAQAEQIFGAPVIGVIPEEKLRKDEGRRLSVVTDPSSSVAEAYRALRNSLDFINFQQDIKTIVVASAAPGEGKSTVAANLGVSLAQAGKKVVIVECDFRRPTAAQFFRVSHTIGLSDVLSGAQPVKAALQRPGDENVLVLTAGKLPPNPGELLSSPRMGELIETLEEWADWVVLDTPPLLAVADGAAVSRWADGVLMVMKGSTSSRDAARKAAEVLTNVGARVIGGVIWGLEAASAGRGYGYYGYHKYGTYYGVGAGAGTGATPSPRGAAEQMPDAYAAPVSGKRRLVGSVGAVLRVLLGVLSVAAVLLLAVYYLDAYFGWGLLEAVLGLIR